MTGRGSATHPLHDAVERADGESWSSGGRALDRGSDTQEIRAAAQEASPRKHSAKSCEEAKNLQPSPERSASGWLIASACSREQAPSAHPAARREACRRGGATSAPRQHPRRCRRTRRSTRWRCVFERVLHRAMTRRDVVSENGGLGNVFVLRE